MKVIGQLLDVKNAKNRKVFTLIAFGIFATGLVVSWRHLDTGIDWQLTPRIAGGMLTLLLLTFAVNALRTHTHSRIVQASLTFADNARIALYGSAMNLLPLVLPAGMLLKMANFIQHGADGKRVAAVLVVNYFLALASSVLLGFAMLTANGFSELQGVLILVVVAYVLTGAVFVYLAGLTAGIAIAMLELAAVAIDAVRLFLCFQLLGFDVALFQSAVLTVSAILGSAVSIVPAGLGIREVVGAAISPLIDLQPAQTFLAIALNRFFGMWFFGTLAGLLLFVERSKSESAG